MAELAHHLIQWNPFLLGQTALADDGIGFILGDADGVGEHDSALNLCDSRQLDLGFHNLIISPSEQ